MEKGLVDGEGTISAHGQAAKVAQPGDGALDGPATPVPTQFAPALRGRT
jgi:hypothetical protein